ncbi:MAG: NACHT domain-containing protein [Streptosporangiaceae bacterium]
MRYEPLADSLRVSVPRGKDRSEKFLAVARRWPRILLTGLPGMGKSTALEQAAARWAADPDAPLPVFVRLCNVASRKPRDATEVTLPVLIEIATVGASEADKKPLRLALERMLSEGEAVLLLDGLDECRELRGLIADSLAGVIAGLPPTTGVALTTRESALDAAGKLGLAEVQLTEPAWLDDVLGRLLRHAAIARGVAEDERDRWVEGRAARLRDIRRSHPDLWRVPLLATLLTLLATRRDPADIPGSRARLLADAVEDTVKLWELKRIPDAPSYPHLRGHLLDGYGEIAHLILSGSGSCPLARVQRQVAAMLAARWGMAPAEAREHAGWLLEFWDEHAGVFVASSVTGDIEPRSRVFAEAGDAMWAVAQEPETRRQWIMSALTDSDRREPVVLAAALSTDVATQLIEAADDAEHPRTRNMALWWAADAIADGAEPPGTALATVLAGLGEATREATTAATPETPQVTKRPSWRSRPGWGHVLRVAMLLLPSSLRSARDGVVSELATGTDEQILLAALAALADARADSRDELTQDEATAVRRLLMTPLPERKPSSTTPSGGFIPPRSRLLVGHFQAAEQATRHALQLGQNAAEAIYRIAHQASAGEYNRVLIQLTTAGFRDPELDLPDLTRYFNGRALTWDGWETFLEASASLAPPNPPSLSDQWRYPHLAALADVLNALEATLDGIDHAFTTDQALLPGWIRAAAHAADLDLAAISAQAAAALRRWDTGNQDVIDVMFASPSALPPVCDPSRLAPEDIDALLKALGATSQWLADNATGLLETARNPALGARAEGLIPLIPPDRRQHATHVAIANNPDPPSTANRLLDSPDRLVRIGAAAAADALTDGGAIWRLVIDRARADSDLTVQLAAGDDEQGPLTATRWTCLECGEVNTMTASRCAACPKGTQPGTKGPSRARPPA